MSNSEPGQQGILLLVSGPAGSGKTTLCQRLIDTHASVERVITATTRPPRDGEIDGEDYYFLSAESFEKGVSEHAFYEHARVHNNFYGVLKREIDRRLDAGCDLLLNIDVQGAASFRKAASVNPELARRLVSIFIQPVNMAQIRERLVSRGTDAVEEIERRLKVAENELLERNLFDHVIVSGSRDADYAAIEKIYFNEKAKRA